MIFSDAGPRSGYVSVTKSNKDLNSGGKFYPDPVSGTLPAMWIIRTLFSSGKGEEQRLRLRCQNTLKKRRNRVAAVFPCSPKDLQHKRSMSKKNILGRFFMKDESYF